VSAAQSPVFVDDTGRRRILTRRAGRIVVIGFTGYLGLVALGFARDPRVGPVHLPTFGLSSLGLMVPPAPPVLGEQATRTAAEDQPGSGEQATGPDDQAERAATPAGGGGTAPLRPTTPPGSVPTASAPAGGPTAPGKTTPTTGVPASSTNSTVPTTSATTSSTTTSTTSPGPGQGQGQGSESASTKGPDGSGPPGQLRKTTTTTAG
jgi:hypothetical protein